jgi:Uma2 family endonuclease
MVVSTRTYEQVALEDPEGQWELHDGRLVAKPAMTTEHYYIARVLGFLLQSQLDLKEYLVSVDSARVRRSESGYYIPDVAVLPMRLVRALLARPGTLEVYDQPLPLVVEVWSPSTGDYDVTAKPPEYQRRGDAEIWLVHPYERTLTRWVRQPDGAYIEEHVSGGVVEPLFLTGVTIELASIFDY